MKEYILKILTKEYKVTNITDIIGIIEDSLGEVFAEFSKKTLKYYQSNDDILCYEIADDSPSLKNRLVLFNPQNRDKLIVGYTDYPLQDIIPSVAYLLLEYLWRKDKC